MRATRVRLPRWRTQDAFFDDSVGQDLNVFTVVFAVILFPFTHLLVPLAFYAIELPIALCRGIGARDRWVGAVSHYPPGQSALWRTPREDAATVVATVAAQLAAGKSLRPARAELIERTP